MNPLGEIALALSATAVDEMPVDGSLAVRFPTTHPCQFASGLSVSWWPSVDEQAGRKVDG